MRIARLSNLARRERAAHSVHVDDDVQWEKAVDLSWFRTRFVGLNSKRRGFLNKVPFYATAAGGQWPALNQLTRYVP